MEKHIFRAATHSEALAQVKQALGPEAVILSTRTVPAAGPAERPLIEVTAAASGVPATRAGRAEPRLKAQRSPMRAAASRAPLQAPAAAPAIQDLYTRLVQNEVAQELAERLLREAQDAGARPADVQQRLRTLIRDLLPPVAGIALGAERRHVAIIGPPGAGKTTALAKLAAHFKLREGRRVALLSLDGQRLAAHEQLGRYAQIISVPIHGAETLGQVHDALHGLDTDLLLIDTPGVALREEGRFVRLAALLRAARPQEVHLALPASLSRAAQLATIQRFAPLRITHLMLTRLDEAVGLGVLLTTLERLQWPLSYTTHGQRVPADIAIADHSRIAEAILAPA